MTRGTVAYLLLLILLLGALLSYIFYSGPFYDYDDVNYITYAHQMLVGTYSVYESTYTYSFLFIWVLSLALRLFGYTLFAAALPNFVEYLLIIILVFLIGKKLKNDGLGLIAALVAATSPYIFGYSTRVIPDMLTGLIATVSLYLFITAMEANGNKNLFYFYSGLFAALTIYSKLTGLLFVGFLVIVSLALAVTYKGGNRKRQFAFTYRNLLCLVSGALVLFALYLGVFLWLTGNPLYAFSNYSSAQASLAYVPTVAGAADLAVLMGGGLNPFGISPLPEIFLFGALFMWCIVGTIIALVKKDGKFTFVAAVLWSIVLYFFLGTVTLNTYTTILVVGRYLIMLAAPISIMAAYAVTEIVAPFVPVSKKWAYGLLLVFMIVTAIFYIGPYLTINDYNVVVSTDSNAMTSIVAYVGSQGASSVFVNSASAERFIDFVSGYNDYNVHPMAGTCTPRDNGSLLVAFYNGEYGPDTTAIAGGVQNWTGANCTLVPLKGFLDTNGKSPFIREWGFNISAIVYEIK
jgi:4-amino-4-deoxy-L-arabinose transferase-like glycosyltransferase